MIDLIVNVGAGGMKGIRNAYYLLSKALQSPLKGQNNAVR